MFAARSMGLDKIVGIVEFVQTMCDSMLASSAAIRHNLLHSKFFR